MFGRLTLNSFLDHSPLQTAVVIGMLAMGLITIGLVFYFQRWKWLWQEWITSLDPKKIGVMYIVVAGVMLFKGVSDAAMMRVQQAYAVGDSVGYLSSEHYQQIFSAHGTTMIFFVGMGFIFGLMNIVVPLQIGARDVAFPFLNSVSFWLFANGALLLIVSMIVGQFSETGWVAYPPLSELKYSPGTGVDYWIWSVQIAGVGSLLAGINFFATIIKMRCPGMTLMKMPLFIWNILGTLVLIIFAFPILTATVGMLALDRLLDMHFFTADHGGNAMMYVNLIWAWGHPEVYILILPAFGVFSEVVATFSRKRLFGYVSMVWAVVSITLLSFIVWLHHFFTMGAGADVNAFFGMMTMLIAVPTGVKIFNWLFTMYRGRVSFTAPMIWFLGFVIIFTVGGMTGVLMSVAPVDFQMHNSLFLIAHFHSMLIGGMLFGIFAGFSYWFPKVTGFILDERLGKYASLCWITGFIAAFLPLYFLGLMGATRRLDHYEVAEWRPLFLVAAVGVTLIVCGILVQIAQIVVSILGRKKYRDSSGDPWNGRTLEWSTSSPPPLYNFAIIPNVHTRDPFWEKKEATVVKKESLSYEDIFVPKNSALGMYMGLLSFTFGFALIWHILWLAAISAMGFLICMIVRLCQEDTDMCISAEEMCRLESENLR